MIVDGLPGISIQPCHVHYHDNTGSLHHVSLSWREYVTNPALVVARSLQQLHRHSYTIKECQSLAFILHNRPSILHRWACHTSCMSHAVVQAGPLSPGGASSLQQLSASIAAIQEKRIQLVDDAIDDFATLGAQLQAAQDAHARAPEAVLSAFLAELAKGAGELTISPQGVDTSAMGMHTDLDEYTEAELEEVLMRVSREVDADSRELATMSARCEGLDQELDAMASKLATARGKLMLTSDSVRAEAGAVDVANAMHEAAAAKESTMAAESGADGARAAATRAAQVVLAEHMQSMSAALDQTRMNLRVSHARAGSSARGTASALLESAQSDMDGAAGQHMQLLLQQAERLLHERDELAARVHADVVAMRDVCHDEATLPVPALQALAALDDDVLASAAQALAAHGGVQPSVLPRTVHVASQGQRAVPSSAATPSSPKSRHVATADAAVYIDLHDTRAPAVRLRDAQLALPAADAASLQPAALLAAHGAHWQRTNVASSLADQAVQAVIAQAEGVQAADLLPAVQEHTSSGPLLEGSPVEHAAASPEALGSPMEEAKSEGLAGPAAPSLGAAGLAAGIGIARAISCPNPQHASKPELVELTKQMVELVEQCTQQYAPATAGVSAEPDVAMLQNLHAALQAFATATGSQDVDAYLREHYQDALRHAHRTVLASGNRAVAAETPSRSSTATLR